MLLYNLNLVLILGLAWPLCIHKPRRDKSLLYLSITFGYMFLLSALRFHIGNDYYNYLRMSQRNKALGWSQIFSGDAEVGYTVLDKLITTFTDNAVVFYSIMALLILAPVAYFIYRYSHNIWLSTLLYATLTFFYGSMNFIRQNLAASILLFSYKFLKERKIVPYMLLVALACCFHITALLMVPVYFLAAIKPTWKMLLFYGGATLLLYLFSPTIVGFATDYLFPNYKDSMWVTQGFSPVFLIVPFLILGAALAASPAMEKRFGLEGRVNVNLMVYNALIWLFITRHFIIERFTLYIYIFVLVGLPLVCECLQASPEVLAERERLQAQGEGNDSKSGKKTSARLKELAATIREHQTYYWCAVGAVILVCLCYNAFGYHEGFHGVFPYISIFDMDAMVADVLR